MLWVLCLNSFSTSWVVNKSKPGNPADSLFKGGALSPIEGEWEGRLVEGLRRRSGGDQEEKVKEGDIIV